jgi:hypothetical protein
LKTQAATFWVIKKSGNYVEIVEELLSSFCALGCNMSLKLHFLQSHVDFFPGNMAAVSMSTVKGSITIYTPNVRKVDMLADYCWMHVREALTDEYKRQKTTK